MASETTTTTGSAAGTTNSASNDTNTGRIPPPPPLPTLQHQQQHNNNNNTGGHHGQVIINAAPFPWILHVRCPRGGSPSSSNSLATVRINIIPEITVQSLGRCIGQAVSSYIGGGDSDIVVAGLFGMHDGVFYSLEYILGNADEIESNGVSYSTVRPPPPPLPPPPTWTVWEYIALIVTVVAIAVRYGEYVLDRVMMGTAEVYYFLFDFPFREFYRYAPRFVGGWEGDDLPDICSRITYYGDRSFWMRNVEECESIYEAKEEAFIRVVRPGVYILMFIILFWAAQHLVASYAEQKRDRTDRAVLDTYHAVQTLIRLSNRSQRR